MLWADKDLWPGKYTTLHPEDLATHQRSSASQGRAQPRVPGDTGCPLMEIALHHRVWLTRLQVQDGDIRSGNHLTFWQPGEQAVWAAPTLCVDMPTEGLMTVSFSPSHLLQGSVVRGWLDTSPAVSFPLVGSSSSVAASAWLPTACLILIQELQQRLLQTHCDCWGFRKSCLLPWSPFSNMLAPCFVEPPLSILRLLLLHLLALGFLADPPLPLPSTSWLLTCSSG